MAKKRFSNDQIKKQQEFTRILQEEIKLLNEIDRKRNETMQLAVEEQNEKDLIQLGEPVKWIGNKSINCLFICDFEWISENAQCRQTDFLEYTDGLFRFLSITFYV